MIHINISTYRSRTSCSHPLHFPIPPLPLHKHHWPLIHPPPYPPIKTQTHHHHPRKNCWRPIHRHCRHRHLYGEKAENDQEARVREGKYIDGQTKTAETPTRGRKGFGAEATGDKAGDGKDVGCEKAGVLEADDDVEGEGGAEVDEAEDDINRDGDDDAIKRHVPFRMNSRKPGGKGQPAVSGKSPHLTGFGRGAGVVAQDQQDEENDGQGGGAGGGAGAMQKYGDKGFWSGGRGREVTDAEQGGDEHDEAHETVQRKAPDHGPGHCEGGVGDLFG